MKCPYCGVTEDKVVDSRASKEDTAIRRRRECLGCGRRFTTYESIEDTPLTVIKSDGRRQAFDKNKLIDKIRLSCTKRPISTAQIEEIADRIEDQLVSKGEREIEAQTTNWQTRHERTQTPRRRRLRALCLCVPTIQRPQ